MENYSMEEAVYLRRLNEDDVESLRQLIGLFRMVFEENPNALPSEDYHQKLLVNPHFLAFCAFDNQKVVGGITAYELQKYDQEASEIFVYDIAVHPDFHRKGLGKQLVEALTEYGKAHNVQVIFVGAHEEDQHALDFYQATGGKGEKVVLFNYQP